MLARNQAAAPTRGMVVWYNWGADDSSLWNYQLVWAAIANAWVRERANIAYRPHFEALARPIDPKLAEGAYLTPDQQAVCEFRRNIATVFQCTQGCSGKLPAFITDNSAGTMTDPYRARFSDQAITVSTFNPDPMESSAVGRTNVVLHELGHAAGLQDHAKTDYCVLDEKLSAFFYTQHAYPWGTGTHASNHYATMRNHVAR